MMLTLSRTIFPLLALAFSLPLCTASHIQAGEIRATLIDASSRTYEFLFVGYRNDTGIEFGSGVFDFGDGRMTEADFELSEERIGPNRVRAVFRLVHSFAAPGTYTVSYEEEFRNPQIANMDNSSSTAFRVELTLLIDPRIGLNRSPILTVPPIDQGVEGIAFVHNPGAFDPDGDSLSYRLSVPLQGVNREVSNYLLPNEASFYAQPEVANEEGTGPASFVLNEQTGTLLWDAPGGFFNKEGFGCPSGLSCAEYNVAIIVEEWRSIEGEVIRLGSVTRDMQITITSGRNLPPRWEEPVDLCVEAGTFISETMVAADSDGDSVRLEAFGGPFELLSPATFDPNPVRNQASPGQLTFNWQTTCEDIRGRPYAVFLKATDAPENPPALTDIEVWNIQVVAPTPRNLEVARTNPRSLSLTWDPYVCLEGARIQVWRRVGSAMLNQDGCTPVRPVDFGYELIALVDGDVTNFVDDGGELGLFAGANYCYRLVTSFEDKGVTSAASIEVCETLQVDRPAITHVDVAKTAELGEVIVRWAPPYEINPNQFPPPYRYEVLRDSSLIFEGAGATSLGVLTDTVMVDTVDTRDKVYTYQVVLLNDRDSVLSRSAAASMTQLQMTSPTDAISLSWSAVTPWTLRSQVYPYHRIYRDNVSDDATSLLLLDSVPVVNGAFLYLDDGQVGGPLIGGRSYCYYIETLGSYENRELLPEPLLNRSSIVCASVGDETPPCAPVSVELTDFDCEARVATEDCTTFWFENTLTWQPPIDSGCEEDLKAYRVYFSPGSEGNFEFLAEVVEPSFAHHRLQEPKGCYRITAVDLSGNESESSFTVCRDNCPSFSLPNAFSPNGDGVNDVFAPKAIAPSTPLSDSSQPVCPQFFTAVQLKIFNRNGDLVYDFDSETADGPLLVEWDGRSIDGETLPVGTYFYHADVAFDVLDETRALTSQRGWLQLLR